MMRWAALFLLVAAPLSEAQTVFKCRAADGSISLQQQPCPGAGERIDVRPNGAPPVPPPLSQRPGQAPKYTPQSAAEYERRTVDIAAGISAHYPVVGMSADQVTAAVGPPTRIATNATAAGVREQRYHQYNGRRYIVTLEGGKVSSVFTSTSAAPARVSRCPGDQAIRNKETQASSITIPADERYALQRELAQMRAACE